MQERPDQHSQTPAEDTRLKEAFKKANEHRDYRVYAWSMDAALDAKAHAIFPFVNVREGGVIVDAGSGTGALAELAGSTFRHAQVYALDISHELRAQALEKQSLIKLAYGDASARTFPSGSVAVKIFSTSGHEIESFGGEGRMRQAVEATFEELEPGGRIIIRDFAKPERTGQILMKIISRVGVDAPVENDPANIRYDVLSTLALLERFQKEFRGGNAFAYEVVKINGEEYVRLDAEWAHEFYLRKDYTGNWRQEIKEQYTYWSLEEAKKILGHAGFVNVRVIQETNEWILKNRLEGKIALFEEGDGEVRTIPFPPTHMIVVGDKPAGMASPFVQTEMPAADYETLCASIRMEDGRVEIDGRVFETIGQPVMGKKKIAFRLAGDKPRWLKIVRPDSYNLHTAFVSMFQTVTRQSVLDEEGVAHLAILESDPHGPPYRYVIQEGAPEGSRTGAELIRSRALSENDFRAFSDLINHVERGNQWQLDTNPHSWLLVDDALGKRWMYMAGKVYRYDERWKFDEIGLWQWTDPSFVEKGDATSAAIPTIKERELLKARLHKKPHFNAKH